MRKRGNYVKCPLCGGKGQVQDKDTKELLPCPKCDRGFIHVSDVGSTMIFDEDDGYID